MFQSKENQNGFFYKKVLFISDNIQIVERLMSVVKSIISKKVSFEWASTSKNTSFEKQYNLKSSESIDFIKKHYDLVISVHCKQIFPKELIDACKCLNLHPGYNPYNRGWYPQVFSILNKMPAGATLHEIDYEIDHGFVIARKEVQVEDSDTSLSLYNKIIDTEVDLFRENILSVLNNNYSTTKVEEGNYNGKEDFKNLLCLDLEKTYTLKQSIDLLRALSHPPYKNGYFIDKNGNKVYIQILLEKESSS